jgi:hypothetical protein
MIHQEFFMSWFATIPLITDEESLDTRKHIKEGFALIQRRRCGRLSREDARCADDETAMQAPILYVFGRTRALRRHVTKRAAAFGTRQTTDRERKAVNKVDGSTIGPSGARQFFWEELLDTPQIGCLADKTPTGSQPGKPGQPMAPEIVPHLLRRVDA